MTKRRRTTPSQRRMRTLKCEFWTEPDMVEFSFRCRLTYAGLICAYADDHGRELDDLRAIKAAIWPQDDDVSLDDIAEDLTALNIAGKVVRYDDTTSGQRGLRRAPAEIHLQSRQRYLYIKNWRKHQRVDKPRASKYPPPPADSRTPREQSRLFPEPPATGLGIGSGEGKGIGIGRGARGETKAKSNGGVQAHEPEDPNPKSPADRVRELEAKTKARTA